MQVMMEVKVMTEMQVMIEVKVMTEMKVMVEKKVIFIYLLEKCKL